MSDTPRTDAQKRGDFVHINFARELERENAALRELLREARDTVRASTVEDGISGLRREYRCGLYQRIKDILGKEAQPWGNDPIMRRHLSEGGTPA